MLLALVVGVAPALADKPKQKAKTAEPVEAPPPEPEPEPDPLAELPHVKGPKLVSLHAEIEIDLPEGAILVERDQAKRMIEEGGGDGRGVIGALLHPDKTWFVIIEYADAGYVSDHDAHELDANALLADYKASTIEQNKVRVAKGVAELFVDSWSEPPRYEPIKRHLVWGLNAHAKDGPVINFFTRILGRGGFISVNLIDDPSTLEASKAETAPLRSAIRFKEGYRYEDYREGDKSSGMGLKALILGGGALAAKKAGVLAGLLVVFKKAFVFIALGIGAAFRWLFKRKPAAAPAEPPPPDPTPTT